MNFARVILTGNLTKDPEISHTQGGTVVANLRVASNSREKVNDMWQDYASYFDVTVFGRMAEAIDGRLMKGDPVAIDGRLKQERWEKDGQKRDRVKIIADNVEFLPRRNRSSESSGGDSQFAPPETSDEEFAVPAGADDDIPF